MVLPLLLAFATSFVLTLLLVRSADYHGARSGDRDFSKPQKVHTVPVPRIGGFGIVVGMLGAVASIWGTMGEAESEFGFLLLACAGPAFLAGFVQDFTEALTPRGRLLATAVSAALAFHFLEAALRYTSLPGFDWLVSFGSGSLLLTIFTVAGIANAVNIIDGLNGLSSMCVTLMLAAIAYVAFQVRDPLIGTLALAGIGAIMGFFVWNFPAGLIFLGDGGAYFLGFLVSELSILMLVRNPGEVSPLFPLLICIYPVFETVFSIYRRRFLRALPSSMPDGIHLHSLIYRRVMRWTVGDRSAKMLIRRNSMASPYLWMLCSLSIAPAVLFYDSTHVLGGLIVVFGFSYVFLYWRIVRFKSPRWLLFRGGRSREWAEGDNQET